MNNNQNFIGSITISFATIVFFVFNFYIGTLNSNAQCNVTATSSSANMCIGDSVTLSAIGAYENKFALKLTGGQYVSLPTTTINNIKTQVTLEAWVSINSTSDVYNYIVSNDRDCCGSAMRGFSLFIMNGYASFQVADTTNNTNNTFRATSSSKLTINKWYHLAGTFDGKAVKIYVDGKLAGTMAYKGRIGSPALYNLTLGSMGFSPSQYTLRGMMDEIRIWNYARTASQVMNSMNSSVPTNSPGLLAYYKFDEGTGTTVADMTGNGNTGTLNANPSWSSSTDTIYPVYKWNNINTLGDTIGSNIIAKPNVTTTYTVTAKLACGTVSNTVVVTVNPLPEKPKITAKGDSLISDIASSYQWYNVAGKIIGAVKRGYKPNNTDDYSVMISNSNGCYSKSDNYHFVEVSINDISSNNNIYIRPNPATTELKVESGKLKVESYKVFDITGKELLAGMNNNTINISHLDKGIYFVRINTEENKIYNIKLIKN